MPFYLLLLTVFIILMALGRSIEDNSEMLSSVEILEYKECVTAISMHDMRTDWTAKLSLSPANVNFSTALMMCMSMNQTLARGCSEEKRCVMATHTVENFANYSIERNRTFQLWLGGFKSKNGTIFWLDDLQQAAIRSTNAKNPRKKTSNYDGRTENVISNHHSLASNHSAALLQNSSNELELYESLSMFTMLEMQCLILEIHASFRNYTVKNLRYELSSTDCRHRSWYMCQYPSISRSDCDSNTKSLSSIEGTRIAVAVGIFCTLLIVSTVVVTRGRNRTAPFPVENVVMLDSIQNDVKI